MSDALTPFRNLYPDDPPDAEKLEVEESFIIDKEHLMLGPRLGENQFAVLFKGSYRELPVVIKIMRSIRNRKADIQKEITLLSEVHDRSIVKFIGASDHPPFVILTELMEGGSLRDYLQSLRPGRIDPKQAIRYSLEIAKAMHFLHERNIVHRDLHPGNVLFTRSQERLKVDFGEAWGKSLREKLNFENKSLAWVAPELFQEEEHNHKVDVYSFSLIFWGILTNEDPFQNNFRRPLSKKFPKILPQVILNLYEACFDTSRDRPEFSEIIKTLTTVLRRLER